MSKVSVIVPVYKVEKYLDRCIQSIIHQTMSEIEIILVDDGSPDKCPEKCDEYAAKDHRVRVIHQKNAGVAAARNAGLSIAESEYVTFVDSDDYVEPEMYEKMLEMAERYDSDVVICDCKKEYSNRSEMYSHNIRGGFYNCEQIKQEYYPHLLIMENMEYPATISNWLILFRMRQQDILYPTGSVRYIEGIRYSEDWLFGSQVILNAKSMFYMKGYTYYHYCMNPSSATHVFNEQKWEDYTRLISATEKVFLPKKEYDFRDQIERMVLFLVMNTLSDLRKAGSLNSSDYSRLREKVIKNARVIEMFKRLKIWRLQVPYKLKLRILLLKIESLS